MHRTSSALRVSDDFSVIFSPSPAMAKGPPVLKSPDELPVYGLISDADKKQVPPKSLGETAVHFIPLVLVLCALVLWLFSTRIEMKHARTP
ncbi:hypothetical protein NMG60_11013323 [Bertholletia excelsa]